MSQFLCDLIVDETNRYGRNKPNRLDTDRDELLIFLWLIGRAIETSGDILYIYVGQYVSCVLKCVGRITYVHAHQ